MPVFIPTAYRVRKGVDQNNFLEKVKVLARKECYRTMVEHYTDSLLSPSTMHLIRRSTEHTEDESDDKVCSRYYLNMFTESVNSENRGKKEWLFHDLTVELEMYRLKNGELIIIPKTGQQMGNCLKFLQFMEELEDFSYVTNVKTQNKVARKTWDRIKSGEVEFQWEKLPIMSVELFPTLDPALVTLQ